MKLFRLTKQMPANWFNDTHRAISECTEHSELESMERAIMGDLNSFYISHKDKAGLMLLLAWCKLKHRLLTNEMINNNTFWKQSYNRK